MPGLFETFLLLIVGHALADYPLQGDYLAKAKNRFAPLAGTPWFHAMAAHAIIHGGFVGVITGSATLGILEAIVHAAIDDTKCRGVISFNTDQILHLACKLVWIALLASGLLGQFQLP